MLGAPGQWLPLVACLCVSHGVCVCLCVRVRVCVGPQARLLRLHPAGRTLLRARSSVAPPRGLSVCLTVSVSLSVPASVSGPVSGSPSWPACVSHGVCVCVILLWACLVLCLHGVTVSFRWCLSCVVSCVASLCHLAGVCRVSCVASLCHFAGVCRVTCVASLCHLACVLSLLSCHLQCALSSLVFRCACRLIGGSCHLTVTGPVRCCVISPLPCPPEFVLGCLLSLPVMSGVASSRHCPVLLNSF